MHITEVELENIKSHVDSRFEFQPGKIAITGENGAGKTSIIEAIAWAIFDNLDYKKEEFIRRGEKKGLVRVTFISSVDERKYTVLRDTDTSYYVFDPIFGAKFARQPDRLADRKEEVARFVRQHLGVEPGTDLKALFRQAIGVPQGTFTAIFLEGPAERKAAFDKLLRVEEYREGAEKLRDTARYLENQITEARVRLARMESDISRVDDAEKEIAELCLKIETLANDLKQLESLIGEKRSEVSAFDLKEKHVAELKAAADRLRSEKERADIIFRQREAERNAAKESAEKVEGVLANANRHTEVLGRIVELERERRERDAIRSELAKTEAALVNVTAEQKNIQQSLENALKAHREIEELRPKVAEQKSLQKEVETLRQRYAHSKSLSEQIAKLNENLERLREQYRQQQTKVKELESSVAMAGSVAVLEKKDAEVVRRIAAFRADLERDQKFQNEVKNGLCPILSEKCLNLTPGQTLESFITSQFSELRSKIGGLEKDKLIIDANLKTAREAEKNRALLEELKLRIAELTEEGKRLRTEKDTLEKRLEGDVETEKHLAEAEAKLRDLDNPDSRVKFLENEAGRERGLRERVTTIERNLERLESDRRLLAERLDEFKELDSQWKLLTDERDATMEAHRTFLQHEPRAKMVAELEISFTEAQKNLDSTSVALVREESELRNAVDLYDPDVHLSARAALLDLEKKNAATEAEMRASKTREQQLYADLKRLAEIREAMAGELRERERLEKISEMTGFIRDTLKESGPRVARNYVFLVSAEANQMFVDITGNVERTLKWNEDYGITLEEDGFERPFVSLSGGEQMAAALSIRLAILKQLSDIRIAFFDEPTTNMDAERRENLAQQISQIKNFDQLFVISHDDTFENYVDSSLHLGTS